MKKLFFMLMAVCFSAAMFAQTIKTVGGSGADYLTLGAAIAAINTGTITGDIVLQVVANSSESNASTSIFSLNNSGNVSGASYTSVLIYPTAPTLTIQGSDPARLAITLNGADNVTIDGRLRNSSGVIQNQDRGLSFNGTTVFAFSDDACNNTIQYCNIKTYGGSQCINFVPGTAITGNDNNTISYNEISSKDLATTRKGIVVANCSAGKENDNNTISYNILHDLIYHNAAGTFIEVSQFNKNWNISNNSFYLSADLNMTNGNLYNIISIGSANSGHLIENNYIGGNSPQCGGVAKINRTVAAQPVTFTAITIKKTVAADAAIIVRNNTIKNFEFGTNITSGAVTAIQTEAAITADNTPIEISKNFISNIDIKGSATLYGINVYLGSCTISNNIFNLTHDAAGEIYGANDKNTNSATVPVVNLFNNTFYIGGTTSSALNSYGYYCANAGKSLKNITNNIFYNARSNSSTGKNYALYLASGYSATNTIPNYNAYIANGIGGVLGYAGNSDKTALPLTSTDGNSINPTTLSFTFSNPIVPLDFKPTLAELVAGETLADVTTDFAGTTRAAIPTIGAYERDLGTSVSTKNEFSNTINIVSVAGGVKLNAVSAQVFNFNGQQVWKGKVNGQFVALPVGNYIVKAILANGLQNVEKVIVK